MFITHGTQVMGSKLNVKRLNFWIYTVCPEYMMSTEETYAHSRISCNFPQNVFLFIVVCMFVTCTPVRGFGH